MGWVKWAGWNKLVGWVKWAGLGWGRLSGLGCVKWVGWDGLGWVGLG